MSQIIIGYTTEGTTDIRFLSSIIERTFVEIAFECSRQIEVVTPVIYIRKQGGISFNEQIVKCSKDAFEKGVMVFCVHVDADNSNDTEVYKTHIEPSFQAINNEADGVCKNVVPIIPVQMTEAWMLVDKQLLKDEIGTNLNDTDLGIHREVESIADPKEVITEAIRVARMHLTKKRRKDLTISELYQPIGQKLSLAILDTLPSYEKFKNAVRNAYKFLSYLQ